MSSFAHYDLVVAVVLGHSTLAHTDLGDLRGTIEGGVGVWRGVHYAEQPVGERRFLSPAPAQPWTGVRDAVEHGPLPPQGKSFVGGGRYDPKVRDEACLTLTVWSPDTNASLPVMVAVVVGAAIIGDTVGYEVGRHLGPRILRSRLLVRRGEQIDAAREQLARRGGGAVFFGRFVAFLRATTPALAGIAGMRYPKFLAFNAAGGLVWGIGVVLIGYLAGNSYSTVEKTFGRATALIALAVIVIAVVVWRIRRRSARRVDQASPADAGTDAAAEAGDGRS